MVPQEEEKIRRNHAEGASNILQGRSPDVKLSQRWHLERKEWGWVELPNIPIFGSIYGSGFFADKGQHGVGVRVSGIAGITLSGGYGQEAFG